MVRFSAEEERLIRSAAINQKMDMAVFLRAAALKAAQPESENGEPLFSKAFAKLFCTALATQIVTGSVQAKGMEATVSEIQKKLMNGLGY